MRRAGLQLKVFVLNCIINHHQYISTGQHVIAETRRLSAFELGYSPDNRNKAPVGFGNEVQGDL